MQAPKAKKETKAAPAAAPAAPAKVQKAKKVRKEPKDKSKNVMRDLRIRKLCVDICVGESGDRLTRAAKVLEQLTGQTPVFSKGIQLQETSTRILLSFWKFLTHQIYVSCLLVFTSRHFKRNARERTRISCMRIFVTLSLRCYKFGRLIETPLMAVGCLLESSFCSLVSTHCRLALMFWWHHLRVDHLFAFLKKRHFHTNYGLSFDVNIFKNYLFKTFFCWNIF